MISDLGRSPRYLSFFFSDFLILYLSVSRASWKCSIVIKAVSGLFINSQLKHIFATYLLTSLRP